MKNQLLHTPEGVRDIYNLECERKLVIQDKLHSLIRTYGYRDIQTPTFEFFDIFNKERGSVISKEMFKFIDREGNTLVLRPDITPSIARCAAKYYMDEKMPLRFCYMGNTFINNSSYQGRLKETTQLGCELIGANTPVADGEMIAIIIRCMLEAGLTKFQVELGEVEFFRGLMEEAGIEEDVQIKIRDLIERKNFFGVEELLLEAGIEEEKRNRILKLQELFGTAEKLSEAKVLARNSRSLEAINRLEQVYEILKACHLEQYVSFELGMLGKYKYYTGVIFKAYTYGTGEMVVTGGRYDSLLQQFGKQAASIGFAINIDQLITALSRQKLLPEKQAEGIFLLYQPEVQMDAVLFAANYQKQGITVELIQKDPEIKLEEYLQYATKLSRKELYYLSGGTPVVYPLG
ncbi:MAG: ATP phosphoribosyltransferase regulatory subunit [Lachnospiraceae bacterium]|nr:ATP phosphoribosyltransferase regulatory subunit [Lachnospiraceae bacterium]